MSKIKIIFLRCTFVFIECFAKGFKKGGKTQEFPFPLSASFGEKNFLQDELTIL